MSTAIQRLNKAMPTKLDKTTPEYRSLFGDEDAASYFDPTSDVATSADVNTGAIANEIEYLLQYLQQLARSYNLSNAISDQLDSLVWFFLGMTRIQQETDEMLINRASVFLRKNGNQSWGTSQSIYDALRHVVPVGAEMYIEENFIDTVGSGGTATDLMALVNGDFEVLDGGGHLADWSTTTAGTSTIGQSLTDPFTGGGCCLMSIDAAGSAVTLYQTFAAVPAGEYKLCWWYKDHLCPGPNSLYTSVQRSSDSKWWNATTMSWDIPQALNYSTALENSVYHLNGIPIKVPVGTPDITIVFGNAATVGPSAYTIRLDRVQFGIPCGTAPKPYPSLRVLFIASTLGKGKTLFLNPIVGPDNYLDRGDCESMTPPALPGETTNTLTGCTFARDGSQFYWGAYSYLLTVSGATATAYLQADIGTTHMHGLTAGTKYTFAVRLRSPSSGGLVAGNIALRVGCYYSASWHDTDLQCSAFASADDDWHYGFLTTTLNAAATGVRVGFAVSGASAAQHLNIDDIRVFQGENFDSALFTGLSDSTHETSFWGGDGGIYSSFFYNSILQLIKPAGVKAAFEANER
jgi:hypothetical protein